MRSVYMGTNCLHFQFGSIFRMEEFLWAAVKVTVLSGTWRHMICLHEYQMFPLSVWIHLQDGRIPIGCSKDCCALWHVTSRDLFTWVPTVSTFSLDPSSRWKSFDVKLEAEHSSETSMKFSDNTASYLTRQHSCEFLDLLSGACLVCAFYGTWHRLCRSLVSGVSWERSVSTFKSLNWTFGIAH